MAYPFIVQGGNIVVVIGNTPHTISKSHISYENIKKAIKEGDWVTVKDLIEPKKVILSYGKGNVSIQGDTLYWKGEEFNGALAEQMIEMYSEGFTIEPMVLFMENLHQNPSKRAVTELYGFLEKGNLPITPDGCFLAFKKIRDNYYDVHSGTVLNKPASILSPDEFAKMPMTAGAVTVTVENNTTVVSMERNQVDDVADNTCSTGLHFCSKDYLANFGGERIVILKINPRDVVSIPSDYNATKGRACRYEVVGELGVEVEDAFTAPVQSNANASTESDAWPHYAGSGI